MKEEHQQLAAKLQRLAAQAADGELRGIVVISVDSDRNVDSLLAAEDDEAKWKLTEGLELQIHRHYVNLHLREISKHGRIIR